MDGSGWARDFASVRGRKGRTRGLPSLAAQVRTAPHATCTRASRRAPNQAHAWVETPPQPHPPPPRSAKACVDGDNCRDNGASPLHVACEHGHAACVAALADAGADVRAICEQLDESAAELDDPGSMLPRLGGGSWRGGGISGARGAGIAPLFVAAVSSDCPELIHLLLSAGADIDERSQTTRSTPLHGAAGAGHWGNLRQLLGAGADLTAQDVLGRTAEALAEASGHMTCVLPCLAKAPLSHAIHQARAVLWL